MREQLGASIEAVWSEAERIGDGWLKDCQPPFWGRAGHKRPALDSDRPQFRGTELALAGARVRPKSIFQLGGAGSVGTGSIRGMPLLGRLRVMGFAVWPFDAARWPLIVEIYPRALTGSIAKSDPAKRRSYLDSKRWPRDAAQREQVAGNEDAFDAAISAREMARHVSSFADLPEPNEIERLEGKIWVPNATLPAPAKALDTTIRIRDARRDDVPAIREIYAYHVEHGLGSFELVPPALDEMARRLAAARRAGLPFLVAHREGEILGHAYASRYRVRPAYRFTVEDSVYVASDAQGRGIGTALLSRLLDELRAGGIHQVVAVIGDSGNAPSIELHRKLGFRDVGTLESVGWKHDRWVDTVLMQLELDRRESAAAERGPS